MFWFARRIPAHFKRRPFSAVNHLTPLNYGFELSKKMSAGSQRRSILRREQSRSGTLFFHSCESLPFLSNLFAFLNASGIVMVATATELTQADSTLSREKVGINNKTFFQFNCLVFKQNIVLGCAAPEDWDWSKSFESVRSVRADWFERNLNLDNSYLWRSERKNFCYGM